jgi:hypothetical protein
MPMITAMQRTLLAAATLATLTVSAAAQNPKPDDMVTLNAPFPGCIDIDPAYAANRLGPAADAYVQQNKNCMWLDPGNEYRVVDIIDYGPGARNVALCLRPPNADFWLTPPAKPDEAKTFCYWTVMRSKER